MSKELIYWTTKDGTKMNVDDMDDNHVRNAFKMLLRKVNAYIEEQKNPTPLEIRSQGEIAQMMIDDGMFEEMDEDWDWGFDPNWD